jgi:ferric-dicitrate binding protein FerR (iron transport regulator)
VKPEKRILLEDVLGDARREVTLRAGGRILRRRRWQRAAARSLAVLAAAALAALAIHQKRPQPVVAQSGPAESGSSAVRVQYLTDDELLALFPNTPVGLITTADGRKRLIFPHPGDEEKYITHL